MREGSRAVEKISSGITFQHAACMALCIGLLLSPVVQAEYGEECRVLVGQLAQDPGALKMGELDIVKSCVSDLQRGIVLGEPPPARTAATPPACAPSAPVAPACPVCPTARELCPRNDPAPARKEPDRERPAPTENRRLKPYLPTY